MSFDKRTFSEILSALISMHTFPNTGRHSVLSPRMSVALCLHYCNSHMRHKTLCQLFGAAPSTISDVLRKYMPMLLHTLKHMHHARIEFPNTPHEFTRLANIVRDKQTELHIPMYTSLGLRMDYPQKWSLLLMYYCKMLNTTV